MNAQTRKNFEVAIVGGGVVGLTCAAALQKAGVSVKVFEAAAAFGEIGAGIAIGPNAAHILREIGVLDAILQRTGPEELKAAGFIYRPGVGDHREVFRQIPTKEPDDEQLYIHRATFLDGLVSCVDPAISHFHKRCISVTESPTNPKRVVLHFLDGTTYEADVVLGSDGIKSSVRKYVLGGADDRLSFSNTVAYRALIPYDKLKAAGFKTDLTDAPTCFMGPDKHFIIFPINNNHTINVVAFAARYDIPIGAEKLPDGAPTVEYVTREEVKQVYEGWGPDIAILLDNMPEKPSKWIINVVHPPLKNYAKARVALLGDAAHGMLPHLGAGAGQGIEDAYFLARLLSHAETTADNLEASRPISLTILHLVYSQLRHPRAQMVWERSRLTGRIYEGLGPHGQDWDRVGEDLQSLYPPVWRHDMEGDVEVAVTLLRERGAFAAVV
ncbi:FAD/NAD-P-binding domain-containing protein [Trametes sanguinea]|nr:FAD/NAD-P-binding domain-containing protein [Trametes sanguinea]